MAVNSSRKSKIHDVHGRDIATLVNPKKEREAHLVTFDGSGLASGVSFYRLTAGDVRITRMEALAK